MIFSVIVPFLNEELYIEQCIQALLGQDFNQNEYELIFIDNGSTDASVEIVRKFSNIALFYESEKSAYVARNRGLKEARGEIIAFTDADCIVSKDWLMHISQGIRESGATIVFGQRCFLPNIPLTLKIFEDYENAKVEYVLKNCAKRYFFANNNNMAVKKIAFERYGYFLTWYAGADTEFLQRCISQDPDLKVAYLNEMKITHLEVKNIRTWLKKNNLYGRYNIMVEELFDYTPLNYATKLKIFNYLIKKNNYFFLQSFFYFFLLVIGDIAYAIGRITGNYIYPAS